MQDGTHRTSDQNGAPLTSLIVRLPYENVPVLGIAPLGGT